MNEPASWKTNHWLGIFFLALALLFGVLGLRSRSAPARSGRIRVSLVFAAVAVFLIWAGTRAP
jgi:hypothetical protein